MTKKESIFVVTDILDMELVERELRGEKVEEYVYEVETANGTEYVPSVLGLRVLAQKLCEQGKPVRVLDCTVGKMELDGREFLAAVAVAENHQGLRWVGSALQPVERRDGKFDIFCLPKATTRAQRNALRGVIPPSVIDGFVEKCVKEMKVRKVSLTEEVSEGQIEEPTPLPTEDIGEVAGEDVDTLWKVLYRKAKEKWGEDFRTDLDQVLLGLFGKRRNLTVQQLKKAIEVLGR